MFISCTCINSIKSNKMIKAFQLIAAPNLNDVIHFINLYYALNCVDVELY